MRNKKDIFSSLFIAAILSGFFLAACENRPLQDNSEISPREIHENIQFHFDEIEVDGIEYLILEKDNNNPHEGFGFMAFRANKMMEKQDTLLAYMRTITELNTLLYSKLYNKSLAESQQFINELYEKNLAIELEEISRLEENKLSSEMINTPTVDSIKIAGEN